MSTETERARERLDALAIIERLESVAHVGDDVVKAGMVAIQRLIDRDVARDRELPAEGAVDPGVPFCIERKAHGTTEHLTLAEWARMVIQDEDEAARIARDMLDGQDPYAFNEAHTGAEPEFYEEFSVLDREALSAQLADFADGQSRR